MDQRHGQHRETSAEDQRLHRMAASSDQAPAANDNGIGRKKKRNQGNHNRRVLPRVASRRSHPILGERGPELGQEFKRRHSLGQCGIGLYERLHDRDLARRVRVGRAEFDGQEQVWQRAEQAQAAESPRPDAAREFRPISDRDEPHHKQAKEAAKSRGGQLGGNGEGESQHERHPSAGAAIAD